MTGRDAAVALARAVYATMSVADPTVAELEAVGEAMIREGVRVVALEHGPEVVQ